MPPSVTISDGTPKMMISGLDEHRRACRPATAAAMPTASGQPWLTTSLAATVGADARQHRRRQVDLADQQDEDDAEREDRRRHDLQGEVREVVRS